MARILVIDDEKSVRAVLAILLKELGHDVELAEDGQKGIELLKRLGDFDLVITDINMPNRNGNEVAKHIRASHRSSIPVIAITAFPEEAEIELFDYMIEKPFMLENMRESVFRLTHCSSSNGVSFSKG
jgi:CheY-like chemotaxis protein